MTAAAQMVNDWLAGPIPKTSSCFITLKMLPVSTLVRGRQVSTQTLHLKVLTWTVIYLIDKCSKKDQIFIILALVLVKV